ncbi:MAG: hypothetical protein ACODAD_09640 [Planctomycetota bacterium]
MIDFEVQRFTRRCCRTNRPLEPGQVFYSELVAEGPKVTRQDFSEQAWNGPREGTIGWWKSQVPDRQASTVHWAPNDVILHYFEQLAEDPEKTDTRYVLALLMIRRRIVRQENTEADDQHGEVFVLYCPRNEREYRVPVVVPPKPRIEEIQNELADLLFADKSRATAGQP